jgi:mono/diheme cytochrome c family protein
MTNASPETLRKGEFWTKHFGCTGCHEISGLEEEQRIGVELTVEGSKPMERLDFGLLTHDAKHPPKPKSPEEAARLRAEHPYPPADPKAPLPAWYEHKGFFMNKLKNPQIYDTGKERAPEDTAALKMPNFRFSDQDRVALTTYLLGSVEANPRLKEAGYFHLPQGAGKAIQEGWWIIKKYNCQGCHQIMPGEVPSLWTQSWFGQKGLAAQAITLPSGEVLKGGPERRPPSLVGQGFRTDPVWLADFLRNPALSKTSQHRNGVRSYMNARMPSFHLSEGEIQKLVAFFGALADQPAVYVKPDIKPLDAEELATARELFNAASSNCVKCHARDEKFDPAVIAPSFALTPARLNPMWVARWIQTPQSFAPGSQMPALFKKDNGRWVLSTEPPPRLKTYQGDHVELLQRFLYRYNEYEKN